MSFVRLSHVVAILLSAWGCSGDSAVSDQPDGFFQATSRTFAEGEPEHAWRALPKSYRSDVSSLVAEFAGRMDEDVWNKGFGLARKFTELIDKQRDLILSSSLADAMAVEAEEIEAQLDGVIDALNALLDSEISTLDGLKDLDLDEFMSDTLSEVFAPIQEMAKTSGQDLAEDWMERKLETSVVSEEGDVATVRLEVEGKPAEVQSVVKVDGVWVPQEMAEGWRSGIEEARAALAGFQIDAATKLEIMTAFGGLDAMLDQLLAAKTAEEFGEAVAQAMMMAASKLGG